MSERTKKRIEFIVDVAYITVIALIVYLCLKYVAGWLLPFIVAFCIVSVIHPLVNRIVKLIGIKQEIGSLIIMILIYALFGALLTLLILQISFAVRDAFTLLPDYFESSVKPSVVSLNEIFANFMSGLPEQWRLQAVNLQSGVLDDIQSFLLNISRKGFSVISVMTSKVPAFVIALTFTIMLSFFISMQYDKVLQFIRTQLPSKAQLIVTETKVIFIDTVLKYIRAAITLMFITFAELSAGLLLLGHKNAIAVAACIAIFDALPFFGTGAIVIPWVIVELLGGNFTFAIGLAVLYGVITFIRNIIEPKVVGDKLGLNPIVSLISIYLGFKIFGVIGMIIMPIVTQIILALHKRGSIKVFKEKIITSAPDNNSEA